MIELSKSRNCHPRKQLVARMLEDRCVLRQVLAPALYGKTMLAMSYVEQVFQSGGVLWIEGEDPSFICELDGGCFPKVPDALEGQLKLLVIDGLPQLDPQRAALLSQCIDDLLEQRVEVIVCCSPARDCLADLQDDRILIEARELQVLDSELDRKDRSVFFDKDSLLRLKSIPGLIWHDGNASTAPLLQSLLLEGRGSKRLMAAFAMLILQQGKTEDLERLGVSLTAEDLSYLARAYPFLGIESFRGSFDALPLELAELADADILDCSAGNGEDAFFQGLLSILMDKGEGQRALQAIKLLCSSSRCDELLLQWGWELLDAGEALTMVEVLDSRVSVGNAPLQLQVMRLWALLLSGDGFRARTALSGLEDSGDERLRSDQHAAFSLFKRVIGPLPGMVYLDYPELSEGRIRGLGGVCVDGWDLLYQASSYDAALARSSAPAKRRDLASSLLLLLFRNAGMKSRAAYRFALHLALHQRDSLDECDRLTLESLAAQVLAQLMGEGISALSQAFLIEDLFQLGMSKASPQDSTAAQRLMRARGIIERQSLLLESVQASAACDGRLAYRCGFGRSAGGAQRSPYPLNALAKPGQLNAGSTFSDPALSHCAEPSRLRFGAQAQDRPSPNSYLPAPRLYVRLLGGFEVYLDGALLDSKEWRRRNVKYLVALLVLQRGGGISRDSIIEEIWPGGELGKGRNSLYVSWSYMRRALGYGSRDEQPFFGRNNNSCWASSILVDSDVYHFIVLARKVADLRPDQGELMGYLREMESIYGGSLLAGDCNSPLLESHELMLRELYVDSMVKAAEWAADMGSGFTALCFARGAFAGNQRREDVYRALMRAQLAAGQRSAAIDTYARCCRFLNEELGVTVSKRTRQIYEGFICDESEDERGQYSA